MILDYNIDKSILLDLEPGTEVYVVNGAYSFITLGLLYYNPKLERVGRINPEWHYQNKLKILGKNYAALA